MIQISKIKKERSRTQAKMREHTEKEIKHLRLNKSGRSYIWKEAYSTE